MGKWGYGNCFVCLSTRNVSNKLLADFDYEEKE